MNYYTTLCTYMLKSFESQLGQVMAISPLTNTKIYHIKILIIFQTVASLCSQNDHWSLRKGTYKRNQTVCGKGQLPVHGTTSMCGHIYDWNYKAPVK